MIKDTSIINDWVTPVRSLLSYLYNDGFALLRVNNGGDEDVDVSKNWDHALDEITATDESYLWASHPTGGEVFLWIVLGNDYWELVADHSVNDVLEAVLSKFSEYWEGVEVKTMKQYDCVCDRTGKRFYAHQGQRTDLHPDEQKLEEQENNPLIWRSWVPDPVPASVPLNVPLLVETEDGEVHVGKFSTTGAGDLFGVVGGRFYFDVKIKRWADLSPVL